MEGFFIQSEDVSESPGERERRSNKDPSAGGAAERRRALNQNEQQLQTCEENRNSLREMFETDLCSGRVTGPKTQSSSIRRAENETRE